MKKATLVTIGLLISVLSIAQFPFKVDKRLQISGNDTTELETVFTDIGIKLKVNNNNDYIKLILENRYYNVTVRQSKMIVVKSEYPGEGLLGHTIYTCESYEWGHVVIETELNKFRGKILIDKDRDGKVDEIYTLK